MSTPVPRHSTVRHVAVHVPQQRQTGTEIEDEVRARNPRLRVLPGLLQTMYGFRERRVAPTGTLPSDLAAAAARRTLDEAGLTPGDVDLLLFASVGEDLEEPATAHVVADKLGVTAPVFDIQNACNGFLNAMETADALIRTGAYDRVLITTGERGTVHTRQPVRNRDEFAYLLPALTLGDLGAAMLLEASDRPGLLASRFFANSAAWPAATATNPHYTPDDPRLVVRINSHALAAAFDGMAARCGDFLHSLNRKPGDLDLVCVHQASVPFTSQILAALDIDEDKAVATFPRYGNVATATLPLQLAEASSTGRLRPGNLVALYGLASGASAGTLLLTWHAQAPSPSPSPLPAPAPAPAPAN
ncbi:3-oxoacyl-[acyl-carrier-protein] synthase III C-terminal domain-containing protein [Streptomyces sp. NPDC091215]|uniref:3-oxoacyl-ACP synthase III family protein n=1 Tax=Streptomyces sp. NPDC091215 TaxID=3155192 RepID=UPI00343DACA0